MAVSLPPGVAQRPHGKRIAAQLTIGKITFITHVKSGTALFLGLKQLSGTYPIAKTKRQKGWKGTQSYTLLLEKLTVVGGHSSASLSIPVSPKVKFVDFYGWAYKKAGVAGIRTPWGLTYAWKEFASTGGKAAGNILGQPDLPALLLPEGDLGNAADFGAYLP